MEKVPFISIIVPVLNAENYIGLCLESLSLQEYPQDMYEIIVLDNGSIDNTVNIVNSYHVKLYIKTNCNVSALRNYGAKQAAGDIFAFIDADCVAPTDWLKKAGSLLQSDSIGAVGCWYALPDNTTLFERTWDILTSVRREIIGPIDWVPSGDLIMHKNLFEQIHGFDEFLITSEDVDICKRIIDSGYVIYSHYSVAVKHLGNPKTLSSFYRKERWRGEGVVQNVFRNFPRISLNKAFILGFVSLLSSLGILSGIFMIAYGLDQSVLLISIIGLVTLPLLQAFKLSFRYQQWRYLLLLFALFIIYGMARASSILSIRVWKSSPSDLKV